MPWLFIANSSLIVSYTRTHLTLARRHDPVFTLDLVSPGKSKRGAENSAPIIGDIDVWKPLIYLPLRTDKLTSQSVVHHIR